MEKQAIVDKYDIQNYKEFNVDIPDFSNLNGIILIVGTSGSGKSTILNSISKKKPIINEKYDLLDNFSNYENAEFLLNACGLRTIPCWFRSPKTLSNGEYHRFYTAICLDQKIDCIDEYTSVIDRDTAKSLSYSLQKHFRNSIKTNLYIASCHFDIIDWLQPDYIYNTDEKKLTHRGLERRPQILLNIRSANYDDWQIFKKHHYLDTTMSKATHCYVATVNNKKVAFYSVIHGCGRDIKSYWRGSRLVVLPEFQGLGIGTKFSDEIAKFYTSNGFRFFAKTAHPSLGEHRNKSSDWKATSTNMSNRPSYLNNGQPRKNKNYGKTDFAKIRDAKRICYSHEYINNDFKQKKQEPINYGLFE